MSKRLSRSLGLDKEDSGHTSHAVWREVRREAGAPGTQTGSWWAGCPGPALGGSLRASQPGSLRKEDELGLQEEEE